MDENCLSIAGAHSSNLARMGAECRKQADFFRDEKRTARFGLLKQFSNVSGYKVNFPSEDVAPYRVTVSIYQMSPFAALQKMLEGKPFEYDVKQNFHHCP